MGRLRWPARALRSENVRMRVNRQDISSCVKRPAGRFAWSRRTLGSCSGLAEQSGNPTVHALLCRRESEWKGPGSQVADRPTIIVSGVELADIEAPHPYQASIP
jgi:hypothetical protein